MTTPSPLHIDHDSPLSDAAPAPTPTAPRRPGSTALMHVAVPSLLLIASTLITDPMDDIMSLLGGSTLAPGSSSGGSKGW